MSSEFEWKKKLLENLLPTLTCLKCKKPPRPEIHERESQRHVCSECGKAICGHCFFMLPGYGKKGIGKPCTFKNCLGNFGMKRCEIIENTLKELPFACKNRQHGCREIYDQKDALERHEKECDFRLVNCVDPTCTKNVPLPNFFKHIDVHRIESSGVERKVFHKAILNDKICCETIDHSKRFGHPLFEANFQENGFFYAWIYYLGTPEAAKNFEYTYTILSARNSSEKIIYKGNARSIDNWRYTIIGDLECLAIGDLQLKKMRNYVPFRNEYITYKIEVKNLKEEAKDKNEDSGVSDEEDS